METKMHEDKVVQERKKKSKGSGEEKVKWAEWGEVGGLGQFTK